jgi:hypothetical protein
MDGETLRWLSFRTHFARYAPMNQKPSHPSHAPISSPSPQPGPIDRSLVIGHSPEGSLSGALADATRRACEGGADMRADFVVNRIFGQFGGIVGQRDLFVEIRLDQDIGQDVPERPQPTGHASRLQLLESALSKLELISLPTAPTQFVLRGEREMPTPGWTFHIDAVQVESTGRISVRVTDIPPAADAVIGVLVPAVLSVQLGTLRVGRYVVELLTRRSPAEPYRLLQAVALEAA